MAEEVQDAKWVVAGRYAIEREVGRGGMASVYLAHDLRDGRRVAVKMLRPEIAGAVNVGRFLREIRLSASFTHPHILPLLDAGSADDGAEGTPYYVLPFVEGESVRQRLARERQLPVRTALAIADQVADALMYAHAHGVLHRDVTPANVLLSGDNAYLADFGIARALVQAEEDQLTSTGLVVGTPAYMSPEQGSGERQLDARSDLYSLATVLYELLAGVPPFHGPTPQSVVAQKAMHEPTSVRHVRPSVPEPVAAALARALAPLPADRFESVAEFRAALALPDTGSLAAPGAGRPPRRHRAWMVGGSAVAAAALLGAALYAFAGTSPALATPARALGRGAAALRAGDAALAERWLRRAAEGDTSGAAQLWLAQLHALFGTDTAADWRGEARYAAAHASSLGAGDRLRAQATAALADGSYASACGGFRSLLASDPRDVAAALGLAACVERDSAVVPDEKSPSGWRQRSSVHEAVQTYLRVLKQLPAERVVKGRVYARLLRLLGKLEWGKYRLGYSLADRRMRFGAVPAFGHDSLSDTLTYVPYLLSDFAAGRPEREVTSIGEALEYSHGVALDAAVAWTRDYPGDADAHATLAHVLELGGELAPARPGALSALGEVRRARVLTSARKPRLHLLQTEARLLVKQGEFAAASDVVDSALALAADSAHGEVLDVDERWTLALLAVLTGRARVAADLLRGVHDDAKYVLASGRSYLPPPDLAIAALRLYAFSAVGAPRDSIVALREVVERRLERYVPSRSRDSVRTAMLARTLSLTVPLLGPEAVADLPRETVPVVRIQQRLARNDTSGTRAMLDSVRTLREAYRPGAVQLDASYQEAWLRAAIGDSAGAVAQLDGALDALPTLGTSLLDQIPDAAALSRAMRLRSVLATAQGDVAAARRWRAAATDLLRRADAEARP